MPDRGKEDRALTNLGSSAVGSWVNLQEPTYYRSYGAVLKTQVFATGSFQVTVNGQTGGVGIVSETRLLYHVAGAVPGHSIAIVYYPINTPFPPPLNLTFQAAKGVVAGDGTFDASDIIFTGSNAQSFYVTAYDITAGQFASDAVLVAVIPGPSATYGPLVAAGAAAAGVAVVAGLMLRRKG